MATPASPMSPTRIPLLDEKAGLNTPASKSSSQESPPPTPGRDHASKNKMEGALGSVLWGAFGPCIPVIAVTSVLLTAVLYHRIPNDHVFLHNHQVKTSDQGLSTLHGIQQIENNGVIPFILGASMALVGFFAGQHIIDDTRTKPEKLTTPHQTSLLISLLESGGFQPLFDTISYRRRSHTALAQPVRLAFWCLSFLILITFIIGAIDSWFGTVVVATQIALVVPTPNPTSSFGRSLDPDRCAPGTWQFRSCPSNPQAFCRYPCSMTSWNASGQEHEGLFHAQEAAETLMTNSRINTILNVTDANNSNFYFLGDLHGSAALDFSAPTLAVKTECQLETQNCTLGAEGGFTCGSYRSPSFSYSGQVGVDPSNATSAPGESTVGIQFFRDSTFNQPIGFGSNTTDLFAAQNPIHFLSWSKGFPPVDTYADEFGFMRNNGYLKNDTDGDAVFILSCSTTIYEAEYYWVNGSVAPNQLKAYELSPDYYGAVYSAPFATNSALSHLALQDAAALAAYQLHPEAVSRVFSDYFSLAAVAFSSGYSVPVANDKEWTRDNNYLATRVPLAPLYTLVAFKAVYAVFAVGLALLAVFKTRPSQAQEIKERLTVNGLATALFEPTSSHEVAVRNVSDCFQEHREKGRDAQKIGLVQTDRGGWLWVSVGRKNVQGLGIQDTMTPVADQAGDAAGKPHGAHQDLGEGYKLVKGIA